MYLLSIRHRPLLLTALALVLVVHQPRPAHAGIIGFATEWTQLSNNLQLVISYIRLGEQLAQQILMYEDMVRNSTVLPGQIFGPIQSDINQLAAIVRAGRALAYSMGNLDAEFRNRFRGYGYNARTWFRDYRVWSETSLDTTLGTLRAAGLQGQQLRSEQSVLGALRGMISSSDGRLRALQVIGDIAEQQTQQLMKLRQLMLADLQSKQAFQAAQIQKEASTQAGVEQFFQYPGRAPDGQTFQAGWK